MWCVVVLVMVGYRSGSVVCVWWLEVGAVVGCVVLLLVLGYKSCSVVCGSMVVAVGAKNVLLWFTLIFEDSFFRLRVDFRFIGQDRGSSTPTEETVGTEPMVMLVIRYELAFYWKQDMLWIKY